MLNQDGKEINSIIFNKKTPEIPFPKIYDLNISIDSENDLSIESQ